MSEQSNSLKVFTKTEGVHARALAYVKAEPKLSLIGGRWVSARSGETIRRFQTLGTIQLVRDCYDER